MYTLVEFKTYKELDTLCSYIQFKTSYNLDSIFKNHLSSCNGHSIVLLKDFVWEEYNPYTSSGPDSADDWSAKFKVPVFSISQFLEFIDTNPHFLI